MPPIQAQTHAHKRTKKWAQQKVQKGSTADSNEARQKHKITYNTQNAHS